MTAQIIFFIAIALFVVIVLTGLKQSRVSRNPEQQPVGINIVSRFFSSILNIFSRFRRKRPEHDVLSPKTNVVNNPMTGPKPAESNFWREERIAEKPELVGNIDEADEMIKDAQYAEAEKLLLSSASRHPKDARIYAKLGLIYLYTKNYNDAIESLKVAVKLDKYNPSRHYNLALAYWGNKDSQRSIASIREAISLDPVTEKYRKFLEQLLEKK